MGRSGGKGSGHSGGGSGSGSKGNKSHSGKKSNATHKTKHNKAYSHKHHKHGPHGGQLALHSGIQNHPHLFRMTDSGFLPQKESYEGQGKIINTSSIELRSCT